MAAPTSLPGLLDAAYALAEARFGPEAAGSHGPECLLEILKAHHFWPALQTKRFGDLVLLHNTYRRADVFEFKELYNACRSVVVDFAAPPAQRIVAVFAHGIPESLTLGQYEVLAQEDDACAESYDGTAVAAYHHGGTWHFSTATCPNIDASRFFSPTKTHGTMLDEALEAAGLDRASFAAGLDPARAYTFILVHHENRHPRGVDYAPLLGEAYAALVHVATRDRVSDEEVGVTDSLPGTRAARAFASPVEAVAHVREGAVPTHGFVVRRGGTLVFRVSTDETVAREETESGSANAWQNLLFVYMQDRPDFRAQDWAEANMTPEDLAAIADSGGAPMTPGFVLHTAMVRVRDILYDLFRATTEYFPNHGRFRMDREADAALPKILRFHLGQLRRLQVTHHTHGILGKRAVYHYLLHHQTVKNVRLLIEYFDRHADEFAGPPRTRDSFAVLARGLRGPRRAV